MGSSIPWSQPKCAPNEHSQSEPHPPNPIPGFRQEIASAYGGLHRSWDLDLLAQPLSHSINEFLGAQVRLPCYPSSKMSAKTMSCSCKHQVRNKTAKRKQQTMEAKHLTRCHKQNAILEMKTGEAHIVNRLSD
jgi:hypothetical protein